MTAKTLTTKDPYLRVVELLHPTCELSQPERTGLSLEILMGLLKIRLPSESASDENYSGCSAGVRKFPASEEL